MNGHRAVCRIRFTKRAGPTVEDILTEKYPWSKDSCQRPNCQPCKTKPGSCRATNITYRIKCETCLSKGIKATYVGESSRSWFDRSRDHSEALRTRNSTYAIVKHWEEDHGDMDDPPNFSFHLVGIYKSSLER